jgi:tyrosyl-tRNA synthetase
MSNVPTITITKDKIGAELLEILAENKVIPSKAEGKRLVQQGGLSVNGDKVDDFKRTITEDDFKDGAALIKRGKKNYNKIELA